MGLPFVMKTYNVAVIGYGWAGGAHIAAINGTSLARVTGVCSSRPHDPVLLRTRHNCELEQFRDIDAVLRRDDIHVVSICSYPQLHAEHLIAAARAGKHFIVEKPIALSPADAHAVAQAVAAAGVKGCVCFEGRFSRQFLATKALIDSGQLGVIHYGEFDYYHGIGPWYGQFRWNTRKEYAGSSLLSAGCHALSALLLCMGNEVASVTSQATYSRNELFAQYDYPTTSVTIVTFKDGRIGKVASVIDCLQPYYRHVHLVGSEGSMLDNRFCTRRLGGLDMDKWSELSFPLIDSGDVRDHPYKPQFEAFFNALAQGEDMPLTSFNEGLVTHRVAFAADLSAREGRTVHLAEMPDLSSVSMRGDRASRLANGATMTPALVPAIMPQIEPLPNGS